MHVAGSGGCHPWGGKVVMTRLRCRWPVVVRLAIACAAVVSVTPIPPSALIHGVKSVLAEAALRADMGWIMGGTKVPDPTAGGYLEQVLGLYLQPSAAFFAGQPTFASYTFQGLITPEQACPIICLPPPNPDLTLGESVNQGVIDLNNTIVPALQDGDNVVVFGYSQSAVIATVEMDDLVKSTPVGVDLSDLHVVLIGDPNSPIGGILDRFQFPDGIKAFSLESAPQHLPFLDVPLSIATTPTSIPSVIYTGEYDGWSNWPEDPTNILADINAAIGIKTVHPDYPTVDNLGEAISLGTIGHTSFYMIPEELPILWPLYQVPYVLPVLADLLAPWLSLDIDWSYGNPGDPGAGFAVDGIDPIGVAGPWAVTATGQLADISGLAGFFPKMDPLQMLAGIQYALVQSVVGPVDEILREAGQSPLPDALTDTLLSLSGYDITNQLDASLLSDWTQLATTLNITNLLGPDAIFDGAPLISGQPIIDLVGLGFDVFNFFGA